MHTQVIGSVRLHFNSDFSGEVILQDDGTGKQVSIRGEDLINLAEYVLTAKALQDFD